MHNNINFSALGKLVLRLEVLVEEDEQASNPSHP